MEAMMKVRVKEQFKDKYNGKTYNIGDELDVTLKRVNEILSVGSLVELVEIVSESCENEPKTADTAQDEETPVEQKKTGRKPKKAAQED